MNPLITQKNKLSLIFLRFIIIYILFAFSIAISIAYREYTLFNTFVFNQYVLSKIFLGALNNTIIAFITTRIFWFCFAFLHINRQYDPHSRAEEEAILHNDIFAKIITIILFSITLLPLQTIVTTSYVGADGIFLRLDFIHFTMSVKIISSIILIGAFMVFLFKKYQPSIKNTIIIFCLLALPPTYNIISTQYQNFDRIERQFSQLKSTGLLGYNVGIKNVELGEKMKPLAEKLTKIARTDSEKATANSAMASTELELGNYEQALEYNKKALAINEYSVTSYMTKSIIYRAMEDPDSALLAGQRCLVIAQGKQDKLHEGRCESELALAYGDRSRKNKEKINKDDLAKAEMHIKMAIALDPEQIFYKSALTEIYISWAFYYCDDQKDFKKAISILDELIAKNDQYKDGYLMSREYAVRGYIKGQAGNYEESIIDMKKSLEIYPEDNKGVYHDIGNQYDNLGKTDEAIEWYEKSIAFDPENKDRFSNQTTLDEILSIYYRGSMDKWDRNKVIETITRLLVFRPNDTELYAMRSRMYSEISEFDKAIADSYKLVEINPENYNDWWSLISLEHFSKRYEGMCKHIKLMNKKAFEEGGLYTDAGDKIDLLKICESL